MLKGNVMIKVSYKVRFFQKRGIDDDETFSPVSVKLDLVTVV